MDFWSRLLGGSYAPKRPAPRRSLTNDPQARITRFRRVYDTVLELCNRPRSLTSERQLLDQLAPAFDLLGSLLRDESRAPVPHLCLQFASSNQIYAVISRAAAVSQYEPNIQAAIAVFAALIDSEEEDFLLSKTFAKSLMRLVTKVVESGNVVICRNTETSILEMLFTIAAKIRLQPEILPIWFQSTAKPELEDVFVKEKRSFVGITQKDDFPLCYLMIDRVHHEGRIGDFARTGLLYIFEATGHSPDLEQWVVSSDLPTLMASGLGALYSQLSRELSILHSDSTLPAVLAVSDYSTTHSKATAESAFSERHQKHMATFLSYLAFWQDVLDHCRSADVKQTLLDHFQILFLQQLLYPSLLQSSDRDAGSSVAVLTYLTAMLESLDYPELINMMLTYLLAIQDEESTVASARKTPVRPSMPPRSPTILKRRQSLMLLTAPKDPNDAVEPTLFNLVDLVLNSVNSENSQTVFAALKLTSTMIVRQPRFALGTLLKIQRASVTAAIRTVGSAEMEIERYLELAEALHECFSIEEGYASLCDDVQHVVESQFPATSSYTQPNGDGRDITSAQRALREDEPLLHALQTLLRTFLSNSIDINLALTQAIIVIASCVQLRLEPWFCVDAANYTFTGEHETGLRQWQSYLNDDENDALFALREASRRPTWSLDHVPLLYTTLQGLSQELKDVRKAVPDLDNLLAARKNMLQAAAIDLPQSEPSSLVSSLIQSSLDAPKASKGHSRSSSASSAGRSHKATDKAAAPQPASLAASPAVGRRVELDASSPPASRAIFQPPPPETLSTTDQLMKKITLPDVPEDEGHVREFLRDRTITLNHVLTNVVVLQEFVLELAAVLQSRVAVLQEREVRFS